MDINATDNTKNTSLHYACWYGHSNVVKILLSQLQIDTQIRNIDKKTA